VRKDQRLQLMGYLHDLDEPYREVFTLYTFCDLKLKEIAQLFGKTDSWARVTYYRARQKLANMIKEKEHGNEQFAGYK
jgi:RNA polymerase sigma-70 factor (ECF subfamily)